ncbi:PD40 domain-containing protein [Candidatus Acetothermia bacterium]|nr:PD40 domain-containing protein [Candidatus Acetothermia bacterium]
MSVAVWLLAVSFVGALGQIPSVTEINPSSSAVHTPVTITGSNFGSTQGSSTVTFNGLIALVDSWSDRSITARVPLIATPNGNSTSASVKVTVVGVDSNTQSFTVIRGIVFDSNRSGNFEIYVMNPDGSGQTRITNNPDIFDPDPCFSLTTAVTCDIIPVWSPDGTKIAFNSTRDGNFEVYVMNADGSGLTRLTNNPANDGCATWSPDSTKIAFCTNRDVSGNNFQVYVMNVDGSGPTNISNNPSPSEYYPASWSPDGTKILFCIRRTPTDNDAEIYVMNTDGSNQVDLTNNPAGDCYGRPTYSPDGAKILFSSDRDGNFDVYVMNSDGSGQTNLTNNPAIESNSGAWSPDGTKIVFRSNRDGNEQLYMMNADGSGQTRITNNAFADRYPSWASGGSPSPPPPSITATKEDTGCVKCLL